MGRFLQEHFSFDLERFEGICQAGLYFLYILSVKVYIALHTSSSLPGQYGVSDWLLGKTQSDDEGLLDPPRKWLFIVKTQLPYIFLPFLVVN